MIAPRRLVIAALAATCLLGLSACGDNGKTAAAAAAVSQSLMNTQGDYKFTTSQTGCIGSGVIKDFGIDQSVKYGFLTKDLKPVSTMSLMLPTKDAGSFADLMIRCADPATTLKNALIEAVNPKTDQARQELTACLNANLTSSLMRKALVASASGDETNATLTPVFDACGKVG